MCSWQPLSRALASRGGESGGQSVRVLTLPSVPVTEGALRRHSSTPALDPMALNTASSVKPIPAILYSVEKVRVCLFTYAFVFTCSCSKCLFRSYQPPRIVTEQPRKLTESIGTVILRQGAFEPERWDPEEGEDAFLVWGIWSGSEAVLFPAVHPFFFFFNTSRPFTLVESA